MTEPWKPDVCIYHFPCDDGFASAWIANRRWPGIVLAPTNYGLPFPDVDIVGKHVLIADFSFKPDALREIAEKAMTVVILDHHKTAQDDLREFIIGGTPDSFDCFDAAEALDILAQQGRPRIAAHFDMEHSGANLTWRFCFPMQQMPELIRYIEDRDLWRFALQDTRAISLLLKSHPYDLTIWSEIAEQLEAPLNRLPMIREARAIARFYDQKIAEIVPTATLKSIGKWSGIPVAHAPYAFASDLAHELLKKHTEAPFAAVVVDAYGGRTYSLRSEDARQDVSEVARMFGGGGHRNAAGFRVPV